MIRWKLIKETACRLLSEANISSPPVDLEVVIEKQGVKLASAPAEEQFSGFLLRRAGELPVIGFNSALPRVRQRFIVAHELGHLLLHGKTGLHVDRSLVRLGGEKADTPDEDETEANRFAAELLMPEEWIREDARLIGRAAVDDDPVISQLAQKYNVSKQAMTIRLTSLGVIQM
jgi:Zn-dependent peptidase ImmA (M78 family)